MAPRRGTRERVRNATRDGLLEAAEQVFADKGIDGARIEDIAARADVAVGTIYNYFNDSTELLQALIAQRRNDLLTRLDAAMADAKRQRAPWSEACAWGWCARPTPRYCQRCWSPCAGRRCYIYVSSRAPRGPTTSAIRCCVSSPRWYGVNPSPSAILSGGLWAGRSGRR